MAVGSNGIILTSPDGITWTHRINVSYYVSDVCYNDTDGMFVGVTNMESKYLISSDGITWVSKTHADTFVQKNIGNLNSVCCANDKFTAVGNNMIVGTMGK